MDPITANPSQPAQTPPPPEQSPTGIATTAPRNVLNESLLATSPQHRTAPSAQLSSPSAALTMVHSQDRDRLGQALLEMLERAATVPRNLETVLAQVVAAEQAPSRSAQRAEAAARLIEGLFGDPAALAGKLAGPAPATGLAGETRIRVLEGKSAEARQRLSDEAMQAYRYFVTGRSTVDGFINRCKVVDVACAQLPPLRGPDAPYEVGRTALAMMRASDRDLRVRDDAQRAATRLLGWWTPLTLEESCSAARARQQKAPTAPASLEALISALTPETAPDPAAADAGPIRWTGAILDAAQRAREDATGRVLVDQLQALERLAAHGDRAKLATAARTLFDFAAEHASGLTRRQVECLDDAVTAIFASLAPRPGTRADKR